MEEGSFVGYFVGVDFVSEVCWYVVVDCFVWAMLGLWGRGRGNVTRRFWDVLMRELEFAINHSLPSFLV